MNATLEGLRVLVVEDEYYLADDLAQAAEAAGAEVVGPFSTADHALRQLAIEPVDLAVLDINLKGSRTFDIADHLAEAGTPFVFATGYSGAVIPEEHRNVPRWEKPYNTSALIASLADLR